MEEGDGHQREVVEQWLQYLGSELHVGPPTLMEMDLVSVTREGHDTLLIQTAQGWARIALISCGDVKVNNGHAIYPARLNVLPIGDAKWR